MNLNFTWDKYKAEKNMIKHRVSFEEAGTIFKTDPFVISIYDSEHSEKEDRWISIGTSVKGRILVVIHTFDEIDNNTSVRIISARKAIQNEIMQYKQGI